MASVGVDRGIETLRFQEASAACLPREMSVWVGAVSFEERGTAALGGLVLSGGTVGSATLLDYPTRVEPVGGGEKGRERSREVLEAQLAAAGTTRGAVEWRQARPYSGADVDTLWKEKCESACSAGGVVGIDITCLTKLHAVRVAKCVERWVGAGRVWLAYTKPKNYVAFAEWNDRFPGFTGPIVAPLGERANFGNESKSRGIILPGHEGQRLAVAIGEMEVCGGVIVHARTAKRPDMERMTRSKNQKLIGSLLAKGGWTVRRMDIVEFGEMWKLTAQEAAAARSNGGPVVLYPIGPKPLIVAAASALARAYVERSWVVYPVPTFYDAFSTEGVGATYWLRV